MEKYLVDGELLMNECPVVLQRGATTSMLRISSTEAQQKTGRVVGTVRTGIYVSSVIMCRHLQFIITVSNK